MIPRQKKDKRQGLIITQARYLSRPAFARLLSALARFPFASTAELVEFCPSLSLHRVQIYLHQALEWGWVEECDHYLTGSAELSGLAAVSPEGFLRLPGIPLLGNETENLLEALANTPTATQAATRHRRFWLTHRGALALAYLVQAILPIEDLHYARLSGWRNNFANCAGITLGEVPLYLRRVGSLALARRFLMALYRAQDLTGPLAWGEGVSLVAGEGEEGPVLSIPVDAVGLLEFPAEDLPETGIKKVLLVVVDPETLPDSWVKPYLKALAERLHQPGVALSSQPLPLAAVSNIKERFFPDLFFLPGLARPGSGNFTAPESVGQNLTNPIPAFSDPTLAQRLAATVRPEPAGPGAASRLPATPFPLENPREIGLVVITRSRGRAGLWQIALSQTLLELELVGPEPLAFTTGELAGMDRAMLLSRLGVGKNFPPGPPPVTIQTPLAKPPSKRLTTGLRYYLEHDPIFSGYIAEKARPGLPKIATSNRQANLSRFGETGGLLLYLLARPALRRLLYTLHAFGPLDLPSLYRLTGVKMSGLEAELNRLEHSGLVARFWGETAAAFRQLARPEVALLPSALPVARLSQGRLKERRQNYGQLGAIAAAATGREGPVPYPYEPEERRLKRFSFYLTEPALVALFWLEGFALEYDPHYRRERAVFASRRRLLVEGQAKLVFYDGAEQESSVPQDLGNSVAEIGFTWPNTLAEHAGAVVNFFLSLPSRHFFSPFSTTPGWYRDTKKVERLKQRLPLPPPTFWLESWQAEPFCHRFYLPPEELSFVAWRDKLQQGIRPLTTEIGYATGQLLPDGYGELRLGSPGDTIRYLGFYLEYERGLRNWSARYLAKAAAYVRQRWSLWLLDCYRRGTVVPPPRKIALLLVTPDQAKEAQLARLFNAAWLGVVSRLWWEATYRGVAPGGVSIPQSPKTFGVELARQILRLVEWVCPVEERLGERYFLGEEILGWVRAAFNLNGEERWDELGGKESERLVMEVLEGSSTVVETDASLGWPELALELLTTNETLLAEISPAGKVWQKAITPWSDLSAIRAKYLSPRRLLGE